MFHFQNDAKSPFKEILQLYPTQYEKLNKCIRKLLSDSSFSEATNNFLQLLIDGEQVRSISTDAFDKNFTTIEWRLDRSNVSALIMKLIEGEPHANRTRYYLYPNDMYLYFHGHGECEAIIYEFEAVDNYYVFDPSRKIVSEKKVVLKGGDSLSLKAGVHGFRNMKIKELVMFELSSYKHHDIVWNFDVETKLLTYPSSADVSSSRVTMAMEVLKHIGDEESEVLIDDLARNHHQHFIRWGAIQCMACINVDKTKQLLEIAVNDEHPEVRIAAEQTIKINEAV